jgi:hypothetical protein
MLARNGSLCVGTEVYRYILQYSASQNLNPQAAFVLISVGVFLH